MTIVIADIILRFSKFTFVNQKTNKIDHLNKHEIIAIEELKTSVRGLKIAQNI